MKSVTGRRVGWGAVSLSLLLAAILTVGQTPGRAQEATKPAAKAEKKEKLSGRLPPYFGEVVSKEQRAKIYEIQAKFSEQLKKLRDQIESLEKQQLEEVHAVLTPEQRDQVAKRTADAKAKRSKTEPAAPGDEDGK